MLDGLLVSLVTPERQSLRHALASAVDDRVLAMHSLWIVWIFPRGTELVAALGEADLAGNLPVCCSEERWFIPCLRALRVLAMTVTA